MFFSFFKTKKSKEQQEKENIQNFLKNIYFNYLQIRDKNENKNFKDCLSLVFIVNEDFPFDVQYIYTLYCMSNYLYENKNNQEFIDWKERINLNGIKNHIIIYKLSAKDMLEYYKNNIKNIKASSVISYNDVFYPVVFCLGFIWINNLKNYNEKMLSIRM